MHNANDPKGRMSISEMVAGEGGVVYTTGTTEFTVQKREGKNLALKAGSAKDARQWVEAFLAWSSYVNN